MKKEFIEVVLSIFARGKRIAKPLGAKKLQGFVYDRTWVRLFGRPGLSQCARPRTDGSGELKHWLALIRMEPVVWNLVIRSNFIPARFMDWLITQQIIAGRQLCAGRWIH